MGQLNDWCLCERDCGGTSHQSGRQALPLLCALGEAGSYPVLHERARARPGLVLNWFPHSGLACDQILRHL